MNRVTFLTILNDGLAGLPAREIDDIIADYMSYFDEAEPSWADERYFTTVERSRGKVGIHLPLPLLSSGLEPAPVFYDHQGADRATYENELHLRAATRDKGYRVLLSGIGGDELLGGLPTPYPELADLLARGVGQPRDVGMDRALEVGGV